MFSVIFEVHPKAAEWDAYLGHAKMLRPELEQIEGFVDNIRYRSLTREGWILSLSSWRDEKAVVRWRTKVRHHEAQEKGRSEIMADYHLRVGQIVRDTRLPSCRQLREQRLDETEVGEGTAVTFVNASIPQGSVPGIRSQRLAERLGLVAAAPGLVGWDIFDAFLSPGDVILQMTWRDRAAAAAFASAERHDGERLRVVRVVRDYGMFDRREAPQFYPDATGRPTLHA
ncbi:MAG: antibiotic biosynthesis monooxygenase [Acetobacteraceae bacterium]|nr:antibiotic biosynthesis monooxygenase [Acetobacteraceae bacterium]